MIPGCFRAVGLPADGIGVDGLGAWSSAMSEAASGKPITVLVVDDEPNHRRCLALGLRIEGFAVVEAGDAAAALNTLATTPTDVAVVDVMMPGVNGLELARRIRREFPAVRVLLMSAYHLTDHQIERANLGVVGFIPKPYRLDDLSQMLRSAAASRAGVGTPVKELHPSA